MKKILAIATILAPCVAYAGPPIYSDNFNSDAPALNTAPAGWTVTGGTVDIVASGTFGITCAGGVGNCVDLDGSTNQSGTLSLTTGLSLVGGQTYTASFDLSGNDRIPSQTDIVTVNFGGTTQTFSILGSAPFVTESISFTAGTTGTYNLSFLDSSNNNIGAILDNVNVQAVPEPETYALMLVGLGFVGLAAKRRR